MLPNDSNKNLTERIMQRKKFALSYNLQEKAKVLTEILGRQFNEDYSHDGGGLAGESSSSYVGNEFEDEEILVRSCEETHSSWEKYQRTEIKIFIKPAGILKKIFLGKKAELVYLQKNSDVGIFREEEKWLPKIYSLYQLATEKKKSDGISESKEKISRLKNNFGLD